MSETKDFNNLLIKPIAYIKTNFPTKFGIPRQSNLLEKEEGIITFVDEYSKEEAIRGLEGFSHLYLIWGFSLSNENDSLTVRPPKLGGNKRVGVFASRSPNRPNPLGLSIVKIKKIEIVDKRLKITVLGADLVSNTPIYDIKPYIPTFDSLPDAKTGYSPLKEEKRLNVNISNELLNKLEGIKDNVIELLSYDPRPGYQHDKERIYGFYYADKEIKFKVDGDNLYVVDIINI